MFDFLKKLEEVLGQGTKPVTEDEARQAYRGLIGYEHAVDMAARWAEEWLEKRVSGELQDPEPPQSLGKAVTNVVITCGIIVGATTHIVVTTALDHAQFVVQAVPVLTRALGEAALEELAEARRRSKG
ncbi:MAG: hypothetical protein CO030_02620 [Candidatus Magasanikbacteria bacterium CG_4_9_14_0_2_um_filter_42_11]|uniref:Uncharacterized protein n=1 Tax=Candidatus Magasanikbacteria bacterium CG_4_9_14_0_2_um_filter_42_11 TaxID=1974643 RepID=A0A2M8F9S5_9BACT|nr:MAG: hypothetical protein COU34_05485 [Candidatus Magasanikbacteria bacterium CG10_big_fil_rev_8_21_14_0_10_43_9]PIY92759.1 MAG: hypothetical protein COY70_01610 [Candidatus Magasanikbacteria bacterium CG_4_10_14_0_8_um_filter_42_12]PJC52490.1 MAG: hypothetical protein CO030_02620 [Candidatus Magasanikbacteria bacterium CG_4_9_14_0_2_um_filter_42_11]